MGKDGIHNQILAILFDFILARNCIDMRRHTLNLVILPLLQKCINHIGIVTHVMPQNAQIFLRLLH